MSLRKAIFHCLDVMVCVVTMGCLVFAATQAGNGSASSVTNSKSLIVPGVGIPTLKLGEDRGIVSKHFPFKKDVDQESLYGPDCGTEINWVDLENPQGGNLFIHLRDNIVFQVDFASSRYQTADGIKRNSSPQAIRKHYKGLQSYVLSDTTSEAEGNRPLVYWIDGEKGIAFSFAYSKTAHRRYLYEIIVFKPNSEICPMGGSSDSLAKRELTPYSLEPSDAK